MILKYVTNTNRFEMAHIFKDNGKRWKNDPSKLKRGIQETFKNATEEEIASATDLFKIAVLNNKKKSFEIQVQQ